MDLGNTIADWPDLGTLLDPLYPSSNEAFGFLQARIDQCARTHPKCRNQHSPPPLPTRVVYIGTSDSEIRLHESRGQCAEYATLSYRWCADPNIVTLQTKTGTLAKHLRNIRRGELPKTMQDAIDVARRLGIRYLWIDALCIIQDSQIDKSTELPKMGHYYTNAFFTISASAAPDCRFSFLTPDSSNQYVPRKFAIGSAAVHVRLTKVSGHLATRGWIWQESALSTRVLNYAPSELIWECKTECISQCQYEPKEVSSLGLAKEFADIETNPYDRWQELVQYYTTRQLTGQTDILPAITGLAVKVHEITGSQYLAGLWRNDLARGLLWEVSRWDYEPRATVPVEYTAPSWSWASVKGGVSAREESAGSSMHPGTVLRRGFGPSFYVVTPVIQIIEADCTVPDRIQNPYGKVTDGFLKLYGPLISVTLTREPSVGKGIFDLERRGRNRGRKLAGAWMFDTELEQVSLRQSRMGGPTTTVRRVKPNTRINPSGFRALVYCLQVVEAPSGRPGRLRNDGIILALSEDDASTFTRIGRFSFSDTKWFDGAPMRLVKIV